MNTLLIDSYLKNYFTASTKAGALLTKAIFKKQDEDFLYFVTTAYRKHSEEVVIAIGDNKINKTECTCSFNYSGKCGHIAASLLLLKKMILENNTDLDFNVKTSNKSLLKNNQIELVNGIIPFEAIYNKNRNFYHYSQNSLVVEAEENFIRTENQGWGIHAQEYSYDPNAALLTVDCTCRKSDKICEHIIDGFEKISKVFGDDYFHADYFSNKVAKYLEKIEFPEDENYEDFFDFKYTPEGIKVKEKFTNISKPEVVAFYSDENASVLAQLPIEKNTESQFGIAICIERNSKMITGIFPATAKYNKNKSDFSSTFNQLRFDNLESLVDFEIEDYKLTINLLKANERMYAERLTKEKLSNAFGYFYQILPLLKKKTLYIFKEKDNFVRKNLTQIAFEEATIKLFFVLTETEKFYNLKAKIRINDNNYNINAKKLIYHNFFIIVDDKMHPLTNLDLIYHLLYYRNEPETNFFKKDFVNFNEKVLIPLSKKFEIQQQIFKKEKVEYEEEKIEKQVYIKDLDGTYIVFEPVVQYENKAIPVFSNEMLLQENENKEITYLSRNQAFEDNFIEEMKALHPDFEAQESYFYLKPEQLFENYWMLQATDKMKALGIQVFGANELKSFKFNLNKPVISIGLKSEIDWFDLEINISFGKEKVALKDIQKAFIKKSNFINLSDGTVGIMPEDWLSKFANYFKSGEIKKNSIQLSNYQFGIIEELYQEVENKPTFLQELYEKKQRLQNIEAIEAVKIPKGLKATLRDYQHHGLNWMVFLHKNQLGGCLADDMGLGKTLQTISFLHYLKTVDKPKIPSLIIAPTSLIFNWMNEIEKFCPTLKMQSFVGSSRANSTADFHKFDIIISTYGSLLNDIEFLKDYKFNYIILDESQAIKNPNSKRYKAVRLLNSFNRLVLTGTPIENNTFDLYAQLNFLNPGLLGNMSHFKTNFSDAIDKEKDVDTSVLLGKIIAPFVLRRTKEQVAKELPDKTESIIYCDMSKEQRAVYEVFKNKYKDYLLNKIDENGVAKSQMYILEGLTKLRQICNSTELINDEADYGNYSAKLEILIENIKEKTGNHKILVFSQFVKMLQIVKNKLDDEKISYEYLDGQTKNRQENVANFQDNKDVRVFLISLKAGGTGLNLTEADYVFIIDPWWNPAVENQAIDRCYRIGQTKQVMAYRMICRDTIEEKIVSLQSKKKSVANSIITIDDEKKSFDIQEVKELFS